MNSNAVADFITNWLAAYQRSSQTKGFVIGVSGGIDSAVTSALAARTGLPLLCVEMPIHQHVSQVSRAADHIQWLKSKFANVRSETVELTSIFDALVHALPSGPSHDMALVNTRARLRMTSLYYFAGLHSMLVLGTGNKVEDFGIGFYTKYGDGGVDISPIADINKSQVYALGKSLGIIESIMSAPPTDGLWGDDRTDEQQIGASYPELEWAMEFNGNEQGLNDRQKTVLAIYRKLHAANAHKMQPIPVCIIPKELKS